jgi:hypothetical protein
VGRRVRDFDTLTRFFGLRRVKAINLDGPM